ncbi:MAG: UDP-N-acetylmuramate dehydrogenase [Planctomycetota bacterium]
MLPVDWRKRSDGPAQAAERLAPYTSWRIGGEAELFVAPRTRAELADVLGELWRSGQRWRVLGGGSNLLIGDRGVTGVVLSLGRLDGIEVRERSLVVEAGAPLHRVVRYAATAGLAGTEPLAGIPGQLGGAIFGNAGGRHGAIGPLVKELEVVSPDGTRAFLQPGPDFFRYRKSAIGDRIVVAATLQLMPDAIAAVRERTREIIRDRRASQPGWVGNAGCVFKNPPGDNAGRLIDAAGCKGMRQGGIVVSPIHANFFENPEQEGRADDVLRLVERVRARVRRAFGVDLEWEVRRWMA